MMRPPRFLAPVIMWALFAACGDEANPQLTSPTLRDAGAKAETLRPASIKVYVGDNKRLVEFAPLLEALEVASPEGETTGSSANLPDSAPIRSKSISAQTPDGERTTVAPEEFPSSPSGMALLYGAAMKCGMTFYFRVSDGEGGAISPGQYAYTPEEPTKDPKSFIFRPNEHGHLNTCDEAIVRHELLLCIASAFEEIANAVSPVEWDVPEPLPDMLPSNDYGGLNGKWIIPPQAPQDRFIARDIALLLLTHIPAIDTVVHRTPAPGQADIAPIQCTDVYKALTTPGQDSRELRLIAFGADTTVNHPETAYLDLLTRQYMQTPAGDVGQLDASTVESWIGERVEREVHTFRAASRMMERLVTDSVYSDLASAEKIRSSTDDLVQGNKSAWGIDPAYSVGYKRREETGYPPNLRYNTISHGIRVLSGSWDISSGGGSRYQWCGTVPPSRLLQSSYGPELKDRLEDRPIATPGQQAAMRLVEALRVVAKAQSPEIRELVLEQLLADQAAREGAVVSDAYRNGPGKPVVDLVNSVSTEDLNFALARYRRRFQQIFNLSILDNVADAKLATRPVLSGWSSVGGEGLAGSLPDLPTNLPFAPRAGMISSVATCALAPVPQDPSSDVARLDALTLEANYILQDVFSAAQGMEQRIGQYKKLLDNAGAGTFEPARALSRVAAAEVRSWSNDGVIVASLGDSPTQPWIYLLGFAQQNFGDAETLGSNIAVVWGTPADAECAVGYRSDCAVTPYIYEPTLIEHLPPADTFSGERYRVRFSADMALTRRAANNQTHWTNQRLFVILRQDPERPDQGRVLGTVTLDSPNNATATVVSSTKERLTQALLGFSPNANKSGIGTDSLSASASYCVQGVRRDMFVPLENELTADSDGYESSWRHYLDLARSAAQHADDLGQQLRDIGLRIDMRREAAQDLLAGTCGQYAQLPDVQFSADTTARPATSTSDLQTKQCMGGGGVYDVVVLGTLPAAEPARSTQISAILGCGATNPSPLCTKIASLRVGELGMAVGAPESAPDCTAIRVAAADLVGTGKVLDEKVVSAADEVYAKPEWLEQNGAGLSLQVSPQEPGKELEWRLVFNGAVVFDTRIPADPAATVPWPACTKGPQPPCDNALGRAFAGPIPHITTEAERAAILWHLEGALFTMHALTGRIPAGAFNVPVLLRSDQALSGVPVVSALGGVSYDATNHRFSGNDSKDTVYGAIDLPNNAAFRTMPGVPKWLKDIYADSSHYVQVSASNPEIDLFASPGGGDTGQAKKAYREQMLGNMKFALSPPRTGKCTVQSGLEESDEWPPQDRRLRYMHALRLPSNGIALCYGGSSFSPLLRLNEDLQGTSTEFRHVLAYKEDRSCWDDGDRAKFKDHCIDFERYGSDYDQATLVDKTLPGFPYNGMDPVSKIEVSEHARGKFWCGLFQPGGESAFTTSAGMWFGPSHPENKVFSRSIYTCSDNTEGRIQYAGRVLQPQFCSIGERAIAFTNWASPRSNCDAMLQLTEALSLACTISDRNLVASPEAAVKIEGAASLSLVEAWIRAQTAGLRKRMGGVFFEHIPVEIVEDFRSGRTGQRGGAGDRGKLLGDAESALITMNVAFSNALSYMDDAADAVRDTDLSVKGIELQGREKDTALLMQQTRIQAEIAASATNIIAGALKAYFNKDPSQLLSMTGSATSLPFNMDLLGKVGELRDLNEEAKANDVAKAVNVLNQRTRASWRLFSDEVGRLREVTKTILTFGRQLEFQEQTAKTLLARATGAPFVTGADGKPVALTVNIVNAREYDLTARRYREAVLRAQQLAYVARLAVEQRLGVRLETLQQSIGPIEAPYLWANDVCDSMGLDYEKLRSAQGVDADAGVAGVLDDKLMTEFVRKGFVGDYVKKLAQFVEFFNIEFPSHDGDDSVALSIKNLTTTCMKESNNILYSASILSQGRMAVDPAGQVHPQGWFLNACDTGVTKCLRVSSPHTLPNRSAPPALSDVTWLHDEQLSPDAGPLPDAASDTGVASDTLADADSGAGDGTAVTDVDPGVATLPPIGGPSGMVSQFVDLEPGQYVVSWWDQGRLLSGDVTANPSMYRVEVSDAADRQLIGQQYLAASGLAWSDRRSLEFTVSASGTYRLSFGASLTNDAPGSVLLAGVQLERSITHEPTTYQNTTWSRRVLSQDCGGELGASVQSRFVRQCDVQGCYYELRSPFTIETTNLISGAGNSVGLAADNYNYRHIDIGINLVGTGLRDCSDTPSDSCYASGYFDYTLTHDAFDVPVVGWDGSSQNFNFGSANINHAKALAAERYITTPLSSADTALLQQVGFDKTEYRGRPLDGAYRLRIWDQPGLRWDRLRDVQVVLKYRYWSAIQKQSTRY